MVLHAPPIRGIGSMRHRVEIWHLLTSKDEGGAMVPTYVLLATRWGAVEQLKPMEQFVANAARGRVDGKITIRYFDGLDETHELRIGERRFSMVGPPTNPDGQKIEHVCEVREIRGPA